MDFDRTGYVEKRQTIYESLNDAVVHLSNTENHNLIPAIVEDKEDNG